MSENVDFSVAPHKDSNIKNVIGVVSGKGGVGKSMTTSLLAVMMKRKGYKVAVLDADVTGPSIPKAFGLKGNITSDGESWLPRKTSTGINIMSLNLLLGNETEPVIWRSPIITNMITRFWSEVNWGEIDYMFVDMPPGTGDVPLTVFQSLPLKGIVIVTSPQELVSMVVAKSAKMAEKMNIPIIGVVENMSYLECPDCESKIKVFGESNIDNIAKGENIDSIAKLPIIPELASKVDNGLIETFEGDWLDNILDKIEKF